MKQRFHSTRIIQCNIKPSFYTTVASQCSDHGTNHVNWSLDWQIDNFNHHSSDCSAWPYANQLLLAPDR